MVYFLLAEHEIKIFEPVDTLDYNQIDLLKPHKIEIRFRDFHLIFFIIPV